MLTTKLLITQRLYYTRQWVSHNRPLGAAHLYAYTLTHPGCGDTGCMPEAFDIAGARDVAYPSHDGLTLRAWYLPPQNGAVVILLPGLDGARDGILREGAILARHGYGLLLTETRSCAPADDQSALGHLEARDLQEAVTWVRSRPGVEHVVVLGFSMGGVTGILGAAEDMRIETVVAEDGFLQRATPGAGLLGHLCRIRGALPALHGHPGAGTPERVTVTQGSPSSRTAIAPLAGCAPLWYNGNHPAK